MSGTRVNKSESVDVLCRFNRFIMYVRSVSFNVLGLFAVCLSLERYGVAATEAFKWLTAAAGGGAAD